MATFENTEDFKKKHEDYIRLLKKALPKVTAEGKPFLYYKEYKFGPKKFPLVLVDFGLGCKTMLAAEGLKPTDEGKVKLTEKDELNFEPTKGQLKRIKIRKYFAKMNAGLKEVFVPEGEVDDEADETEVETAGEGTPTATTKPMPPLPKVPPPTTPLPPVPPRPESPKQPAPQPPVDPAKQKLESELRQRIEALRKQPVDLPMEQMKTQVLQKAEALVAGGRFPDATLLLDQYVKKVAVPITPTPPVQPKPEAPKGPAPSPKLSTYMGATKRWKEAKTASANGVFALKTAILKECDPELKKAVEAKINEVNSILTVMDDGIIAKIQEAGNEADEERQVERNQAIVKFANGILDAVRKHRHADVVDKNPFGTFAIREPVETVLTKIVTDFGG